MVEQLPEQAVAHPPAQVHAKNGAEEHGQNNPLDHKAGERGGREGQVGQEGQDGQKGSLASGIRTAPGAVRSRRPSDARLILHVRSRAGRRLRCGQVTAQGLEFLWDVARIGIARKEPVHDSRHTRFPERWR